MVYSSSWKKKKKKMWSIYLPIDGCYHRGCTINNTFCSTNIWCEYNKRNYNYIGEFWSNFVSFNHIDTLWALVEFVSIVEGVPSARAILL